jgi:hypothetical protein
MALEWRSEPVAESNANREKAGYPPTGQRMSIGRRDSIRNAAASRVTTR